MTIPDAAVDAFKAAWHTADDEGRTGQRVQAGLAAAAPHIAAQALRDAAEASRWHLGTEVSGHTSTYSVRKWLYERADQIEADHG